MSVLECTRTPTRSTVPSFLCETTHARHLRVYTDNDYYTTLLWGSTITRSHTRTYGTPSSCSVAVAVAIALITVVVAADIAATAIGLIRTDEDAHPRALRSEPTLRLLEVFDLIVLEAKVAQVDTVRDLARHPPRELVVPAGEDTQLTQLTHARGQRASHGIVATVEVLKLVQVADGARQHARDAVVRDAKVLQLGQLVNLRGQRPAQEIVGEVECGAER